MDPSTSSQPSVSPPRPRASGPPVSVEGANVKKRGFDAFVQSQVESDASFAMDEDHPHHAPGSSPPSHSAATGSVQGAARTSEDRSATHRQPPPIHPYASHSNEPPHLGTRLPPPPVPANPPPTPAVAKPPTTSGPTRTVKDERTPGSSLLPLSRVQKIMKADKELGGAGKEAVFLIAVAAEEFIKRLVLAGHAQSRREGRMTVLHRDLAVAVKRADELTFLEEIIPQTVPASVALAKRQLKLDKDKEQQKDKDIRAAAQGTGGGPSSTPAIAKAFANAKGKGASGSASTDGVPATKPAAGSRKGKAKASFAPAPQTDEDGAVKLSDPVAAGGTLEDVEMLHAEEGPG